MKHLPIIAALFFAPFAHGQVDLIGTTVTGFLSGVPSTTNFWDPGSGLVPSTGFQNSSSNQDSATVTIVGGDEFGSIDGGPDVSFTSSGFTLTKDLPDTFVGFGAYQITLTDTAFENLELISTTFAGLTDSISGDTISIDIPLTNAPPYDYSASFSVNTPEPSTLALMALGFFGVVLGAQMLGMINLFPANSGWRTGKR